MIARGRHELRVTAAYSKDSSQNIVKIDIGPEDDTVPVDARWLFRQIVLALAAEVQLCITAEFYQCAVVFIQPSRPARP